MHEKSRHQFQEEIQQFKARSRTMDKLHEENRAVMFSEREKTEAANRRIAELEKQLGEQESIIVEKMEAKYTAQVEKLQETLQRQKQDLIDGSGAEIAGLQRLNDEANQTINRLNIEKQELTVRLERANMNHEDSVQSKTLAEEQQQSLQQALLDTKQELETVQTRCTEAESKLEEQTSAYQQLEASLASLRTQAEDQQGALSQVEVLSSKNAKLSERVNMLTTQVEDERSKIAYFETSASEMEEELLETQDELRVMTEERNTQAAELETKAAEVKSLQEKVQQEESNLGTVVEEHKKVKRNNIQFSHACL